MPRTDATVLGLMQSPITRTFRKNGLSVLNWLPKGGRSYLPPPGGGAGGGIQCRSRQRPPRPGSRQRPGLQPLERLLCRRRRHVSRRR